MQFEIQVYDAFDKVPEGAIKRWNSSSGLPFDLTLQWFTILYEEVMRTQGELLLFVACRSDGKTPVAILPTLRNCTSKSRMQRNMLVGLSNYYSSNFEPVLFEDMDRTSLCESFVREIARLEKKANIIDFSPINSASENFGPLKNALQGNGYFVTPYFRFGNWIYTVSGKGFAEYLAERPGALRNTLDRKTRKLEKHGYEVKVIDQLCDLDGAMADYEYVYERSWKVDESHPAFVRKLCAEFASRNWLRLGVLYVGSDPVAAQIWFVKSGVASIFKLAYAEESKNLSAGSILTMSLMKRVIDIDRVEVVDYLTGDDRYKADYMGMRREMWGLRAYRKKSLAGAAGIAQSLRRWWKSTNGRQ